MFLRPIAALQQHQSSHGACVTGAFALFLMNGLFSKAFLRKECEPLFLKGGHMSQAAFSLATVDEVTITTIVDNSVDILLESNEVVRRYPLGQHAFEHPQPIAEHGFSALITVTQGAKCRQILFDTGLSARTFLYNLDALEINVADIQAIVLSHGHADHVMGFFGLVQRLGSRSLPLVLHPDVYLERKVLFPNGDETFLPAPRKVDLQRENIHVLEQIQPSLLIEDMVLVSGEVPRQTTFEQGFPIHYAKREHQWEPDPLIRDDQCTIMHVQGKGLVIVTGCGHAGIVNIIHNAQALTGIQTIYAVLGGFHLSGPLFEPLIPQTVAALQELHPHYLVPAHCTGWRATHALARAMPKAFLANSVGTSITLS